MLREQCKEASQYVIDMRRKFHQVPELGIHLPESQALICAELDKMGIPYRRSEVVLDGVRDSSVVAFIEGASTDKVIALRADFDALPVPEETGEPFASTIDGRMHACGHDAHAAMLLGAAKVLSANKDLLKGGSVKLFFQSGEEIITGARLMIEDGALENPTVTATFGIHIDPMGTKNHKSGAAVIVPGCIMASGNRMVIRIKGKGTHGSQPQNGIDPIMAGAQVVTALQALVGREVAGDVSRVLSICQFHGGSCWNVIPDEVMLEGTLRTTAFDIREFLTRRIGEVARGVCRAMNCECDVDWVDGTPPVVNDPEFQKLVAAGAKKILGEDYVVETFKTSMGNEDMARFMELVPHSLFAFLNVSNEDPDTCRPWHNSKLKLAEEVLWHGTALHVQTAVDYLS